MEDVLYQEKRSHYREKHPDPMIASIVDRIHEKLLKKFTHMKAAFKWFDTNQDGCVNLVEFTKGVEGLGI